MDGGGFLDQPQSHNLLSKIHLHAILTKLLSSLVCFQLEQLGTTSIPIFVTQNGQWPLGGWGFEQWPFSVNEVGCLF